MLQPLLIFAIAFAATFMSAMSGAGAALIAVPSWLMLGFPLPVAVAAEKVNGTLWTLLASRNYLRKQPIDWAVLLLMAPVGLIGAYIGAMVTVSFDPRVLSRVIGVVIIGAVLYTFLKKGFGAERREAASNRVVTGLLGLPLGFYEGFFGSGNGIFTSIALCKTRGLDLISGLGHYYLLAFFWCLFAAGVYAFKAQYDLLLMVPAAFGAVLGGHLGSAYSKRKGARFVKGVFVFFGTVFGMKLALGY